MPASLRRRLRLILEEGPRRVRDLVPDLAERVWRREPFLPLPPARLRLRVAGTSSREVFLRVGKKCAEDFVGAFESARRADSSYERWLDFGCGSGRVARHLPAMLPHCELWGADVDGEAVEWASKHLPGTFRPVPEAPPTRFPADSFDVVLAGSVFTHLASRPQMEWLKELHRILRSGGLLLASTHGPALTFSRPDLTAEQREELDRTGFLFATGSGPFNEDSAFHSNDYLVRSWGQLFGLRLFLERGLAGYQDLSAWCKW